MGVAGRREHKRHQPHGRERLRSDALRFGTLLKRIYTAANLPEAQLLADRLAAGGIRACIFNANASSIAGELPVDQAAPQLWVENPGHAARARLMIDDFLRAAPAPGPPHPCPSCGEESPSAFEVCWACGATL